MKNQPIFEVAKNRNVGNNKQTKDSEIQNKSFNYQSTFSSKYSCGNHIKTVENIEKSMKYSKGNLSIVPSSIKANLETLQHKIMSEINSFANHKFNSETELESFAKEVEKKHNKTTTTIKPMLQIQ